MSKKANKFLKENMQNSDIDILDTDTVINSLDDTDGYSGAGSAFTTQNKAAGILGISLPTLRKYYKLGFITRFRLGHRFYYRLDELHELKKNFF